MAQEVQSDEKIDWHMSKVHETIISKNANRSEKLGAYAAWADNYDKDINDSTYSSPEILASDLFKYLPASPTGEARRVLDAGCGTGLVAPAINEAAEKAGVKLDMVGLDYSPEMLELADKKGVYSSVVEADLTKPLPFPNNSFDGIVAGALFVEGHCGPSVLPNMINSLKVGSVAVFTIREQTYNNEKEIYDKAFEDSKCEVVENYKGHYLGPVQCHYVVLRKTVDL